MSATANHHKFLNHLEQSVQGVMVATKWLVGKGYEVVVRPTSKAPTHGEWQKHADTGDIFIMQRIEVKQLSVNFSGRHDWPFGSKFIVCAKHSFDRAKPRPFAYLVLSGDSQSVAIVKSESRPRWSVESRTDRRYENVSQEFYLAPMDEVSFQRL